MTGRGTVATITLVIAAEQVHLTLDLDPTPGTMRGSLTDTHGDRRPFDGWVQLANALRAAHGATQSPVPDPQNGAPT